MTETEAPKIEFPCEDYPIKVMGDAVDDFHTVVVDIIEKYAPKFDRSKTTIRDSRNSRYQAVTVYITATGEPQLKALFEDLKTFDAVKMVL